MNLNSQEFNKSLINPAYYAQLVLENYVEKTGRSAQYLLMGTQTYLRFCRYLNESLDIHHTVHPGTNLVSRYRGAIILVNPMMRFQCTAIEHLPPIVTFS